MIHIQYAPVRSKLTGTDKIETKLARALLSQEFTFEVPGYFFSPKYQDGLWDGRESFFTENGTFLSGLLSRVLGILHKAEFEVEVHNYPDSHPKLSQIAFGPVKLNDDNGEITLYDHQMHALYKALKYSRGIWKIATNGGKTEAMAGLIKVMGYPVTICLCPRQEILLQTVQRLEKRLDKPVGIIGGGIFDPVYSGVTVAMFQTLLRRSKDKTIQRWLREAELLFGDEIHFITDNGYATVFTAAKAPVRIGMSGTPFREGIINKMRTIGTVGPVLCTVGNKELIDKGVSVRPKVMFLEPRIDKIKAKCMEGDHWAQAIIKCTERHQLIANLANGFVEAGSQTVIMVSRIEHGGILQNYIPGSILVHSGSSNRKKVKRMLEQGDVFCCICTSIFDTGLSVDHMECLINAAGGRDIVTLLQRLGRLLRKSKLKDKDIWFMDFWDTFNRLTRAHSRERWDILKNENAFDMLEDVKQLPPAIQSIVLEGAGVGYSKILKKRVR